MKYHWINPDYPLAKEPKRAPPLRRELTDILMLIYCRKNTGDTKHLALPGNYLYERIGRRLEDSDLPLISKFLATRRDVVSVELSYNEFSATELGPFMTSLVDNASPIHYLGLMNCGLGMDELEVLAENVCKTNIGILRINDNNFGRKAADLMDLLLRRGGKLTVLDIGNIGCNWGLVGSLTSALINHETNLQVLDMSRIVPGALGALEHTGFLSEMIEMLIYKCRTLKEFHLRNNSLNGQDMETICLVAAGAKNLLYLDVAGNRIGDKGAEYLADMLRGRPSLIGLNISANNIGEIGGRALGHALPHSVLRLLDISHNKFCEEGLRLVLHTLKKPRKMRILNLWGNTFHNSSAAIIYRMQLSGVLEEDCIDVRAVYEDGLYRVAQKTNPYDAHRERYYLISVPSVRPMEPYVERPRKQKIKCKRASEQPRPAPPSSPPVEDKEQISDAKSDAYVERTPSGSVTRDSAPNKPAIKSCLCRSEMWANIQTNPGLVQKL